MLKMVLTLDIPFLSGKDFDWTPSSKFPKSNLSVNPISFETMASNINITVQATDRKFTVVVPSDISVSAFKRRIQADVGCEPSLHRLIHRGRILEDDKSFSFYGKTAN